MVIVPALETLSEAEEIDECFEKRLISVTVQACSSGSGEHSVEKDLVWEKFV